MKRYIPFLFLMFLFGCKDLGVNVPPSIPIDELLASPDTVLLAGKHFTLSASLWRSFMPTIPKTNSGIVALALVTATDSSDIPASINVDAIWIVYRGQVWSSFLETASQQTNRTLARIARNGPEWDGPVDIIVRTFDSQSDTKLLRVSQQVVGKVY